MDDYSDLSDFERKVALEIVISLHTLMFAWGDDDVNTAFEDFGTTVSKLEEIAGRKWTAPVDFGTISCDERDLARCIYAVLKNIQEENHNLDLMRIGIDMEGIELALIAHKAL